jgi:dipeptidyl aminopeptidase/acylaminoacyl peptidase
MKATGAPFLIAENGAFPSVSLDGTLLYVEGAAAGLQQRLAWRDRQGNPVGTIGQPQDAIRYPALSPDGERVAVMGRQGGDRDIWIHEVGRPVKTRLTTDNFVDLWPTWSPTGDRVAFASGRTGMRDIYSQRADGSGQATPLLLTEGAAEYFTDWSRDERTLLFFRRLLGTAGHGFGDIFYLQRKDDGSYDEVAYQATQFEETTPRFSPDERFIAYVSDESGQREIYVQAFPQGDKKRRVSVNGGIAPRWRADGKELFYVEGETLMATPISTSPSLTVGSPQALFMAPGLAWQTNNFLGYDVTPDGRKFVIWEPVEPDEDDTGSKPVIRVVENWYEEFRGREQE